MARPATRSSFTPPDHHPDLFLAWARAFRVGAKAPREIDWSYVKEAHRKGDKVLSLHIR